MLKPSDGSDKERLRKFLFQMIEATRGGGGMPSRDDNRSPRDDLRGSTAKDFVIYAAASRFCKKGVPYPLNNSSE